MHRLIAVGIVFVLFSGLLQAQGGFSIRAASSDSVAGWQRMELDGQTVWVSPTVSLTAADVGRAEPISTQDGKKAVSIEFTDAGAGKMRKLSAAQKDKLIGMVLDGKLIWAPKIRSEIGKQAVLTGTGPLGLSDEVISRIIASVRR